MFSGRNHRVHGGNAGDGPVLRRRGNREVPEASVCGAVAFKSAEVKKNHGLCDLRPRKINADLILGNVFEKGSCNFQTSFVFMILFCRNKRMGKRAEVIVAFPFFTQHYTLYITLYFSQQILKIGHLNCAFR